MQHPPHHQLPDHLFRDWIPFLLVLILALGYLGTTVVLKRKKRNWSGWHTLSFLVGTAFLGMALLPSLMHWAHSDLRGHMVQHLLLGMFSPIFLVLGAPITLGLKALPVKAARGLTTILRSSVFQFLSHPVTAFLLNIGGMYVLYLTPLYNQSLANPSLHYLIHFHFLGAGFLFTWSMIGLDPAPNRPGFRVRLIVLFFSIAAHAFLSKYMYAYGFPLHSPHSEEQVREAAKLMYYWGDLSELLLTISLFATFYQTRQTAKHPLFPLTT